MAFLPAVHKYLLSYAKNPNARLIVWVRLICLADEIVTLYVRYFGVGSPHMSSAKQRTGVDEK